MARTRIGSKLIAVSGVHKDNIQSGSIEIKHLDFVGNVSGHLVDLADADTLAILDASVGGAPAGRMKALKLSDLKSYISASAGVGGRTGSIQFAQADGGNLEFAGMLDFTSDGKHLTASAGRRIYFTNAALGTSPKHQYIHGSAAGKLDIVADNTGSGQVIVRAGKKVQLRTVANTGMAVGVISSAPVLMDGRDAGNASHRSNIRFDTNNSAPAVTIYSGSTAVFGTRGTDVQLRPSGGKLYFDNGTTYYAGSTSNLQFLTASAAKITSLEVDNLVSRTTTKESLEIKDNLVIAAVSGSKHANFIGAGFQVGGKVGVQGTGSAALMSMTLEDPALNQGSMALGVNATRIVSITSGSFFTDGTKGDGILAVTGAISASYARAQNVHAVSVSGAAGTFQRVVTNKLAGNGIVEAANIKASAVETAKIADAAVTHAKIGVGAVRPDNLDTGSILTAHIGDAQVTHAKIGVGAIRPDNLDTGSILTAHIGAGQVTHAKLATGAITADNIQTGSVNSAHLVAGSITHVKLATGAITADNIQTGSVNAGHLVAGSITHAKLATGAVANDNISSGSVEHDHLALGAVTADNIQTGSINTAHIADVAVTHAKIGVGAVRPDNLDTGSILTAHISDASVTHAKLGVSAVTPDNLGTGSVLTAHIATGQITHVKLATGAVTADNIQTGSVNSAHIVAAAVTHAKLATGAVTKDNISSGSIEHDHLATGIITADNIQTGSINTAHIADGAVGIDALATGSVGTKQLHVQVVQNNLDAHGGINYAAGRLSVGYRKGVFVRADGSNISGSTPKKGFFATNAVPTPYTTASLGAQPQSGSLMVYLNGVLLHGQHATAKSADLQDPSLADYRITTASNAHKVLLHPDLALDDDDIMTITYLSGTLS